MKGVPTIALVILLLVFMLDGRLGGLDSPSGRGASNTVKPPTGTPNTVKPPAGTPNTVKPPAGTPNTVKPNVKPPGGLWAGVKLAPSAQINGYDRDHDFPHWRDIDGNGCDAREDTLKRDAKTFKPKKNGCAAIEGTWYDPYKGGYVTNKSGDIVINPGAPSVLDIDHIIPLAEANRSGAANWSVEQGKKFANDPFNIIAVTASLNREKGDKDPSRWRPPNKAYHRQYAIHWIQVKKKYGLSIDPAEEKALKAMLG